MMETPARPGRRSLDARVVLVLSGFVTVVLYLVPGGRWVAYPLVWLSTFAHEMGHGITACLVGGEFEALRMYADGSGIASVGGFAGRLASGLVAAGGLVGPAVAAAILFVVGARARWAKWGLAVGSVFLAGAALLVVRSGFGLAVVLTAAANAAAVAVLGRPRWAQLVTVFVAMQLSLSVFSRGDYLFMEVAQTELGAQPSDVALMAQALWLPYWFWGAVCGALSVLVLLGGLRLFWRVAQNQR